MTPSWQRNSLILSRYNHPLPSDDLFSSNLWSIFYLHNYVILKMSYTWNHMFWDRLLSSKASVYPQASCSPRRWCEWPHRIHGWRVILSQKKKNVLCVSDLVYWTWKVGNRFNIVMEIHHKNFSNCLVSLSSLWRYLQEIKTTFLPLLLSPTSTLSPSTKPPCLLIWPPPVSLLTSSTLTLFLSFPNPLPQIHSWPHWCLHLRSFFRETFWQSDHLLLPNPSKRVTTKSLCFILFTHLWRTS